MGERREGVIGACDSMGQWRTVPLPRTERERIERWLADGRAWRHKINAEAALAGEEPVRLVELRDGEAIVPNDYLIPTGMQELRAERDALKVEVERLRLHSAAVPHGPDLLALGAQVGDVVVCISAAGAQFVVHGVIECIDVEERSVLLAGYSYRMRTSGGHAYCGEWFILRKGSSNASTTRPASEPAAAGGGEAEPQGQVGAQVRHGSQERRHAEGYAETRTVAPQRALGDDAAADRESRTIDGVIHEPGCRVHVLSKRPLSPEGCTCRPEPGSEHRDIRMLKPERGDKIGRRPLSWEFVRMDGPSRWVASGHEYAFDAVSRDPWRLIARAAKPKPSEPAELPDAEKRELERRRDELLKGPYRIRHTIYGGHHHVAIDCACGEWQYGQEHIGRTYHHALKAALAAHDAREGKP